MRGLSVAMVGEDIEPPWADGVVNTIKNWCEGLSQYGASVCVLSTTSQGASFMRLNNVSYLYLGLKQKRFEGGLIDAVRFQREIIRNVKLADYDVVHFHGIEGLTSVPPMLYMKLRRKKRISSYHSTTLSNFTIGFKNIMFNRFTVPSTRIISKLVKHGIPKNKIAVIHPSVDTDIFHSMNKTKARNALGLPDDSFIMLYAGHFKKGRGILELISKYKELVNKGAYDVKLVLAWTGQGEAEIISALSDISRKDHGIIILGPTNNMPTVYNAADVYILPVRDEKWVIEIPLSLVEALSCGVPAISFNVGGISELIVNGVNGFLLKPNDFTSLKDILTGLLKDRIDVNHLSKNARKTIVDRFSNQNVAKKLLSLYEELL